MKKCPKCGTFNPDKTNACFKCKSDLITDINQQVKADNKLDSEEVNNPPSHSKGFFTSCDCCHKWLFCFEGVSSGNYKFCSYSCLTNLLGKRVFCPKCLSSSGPDLFDGASTLNAIGTTIHGSAEPCLKCGSFIVTKWICVFLPLIPLESYRVLQIDDKSYFGRKVPLYISQVVNNYIFLLILILFIVAIYLKNH